MRDVLDYPTRHFVNWWIANSEHGAALARLPRAQTTIIRNGLPDELLTTPLERWQPAPQTAIMIGNFRREKRYDILLSAAKEMPHWHFILVGNGPLLEREQDRARRLDVRNVQFLGKRADTVELLLGASVCVLLSRSEGTPNVTLEAMALGVPMIGSDIPAHRELLGQGRGLIIPNQSEALVAALKLRQRMSARSILAMRSSAQRYVQERFTTPRMVAQTQDAWLQVARASSAR
jgi:glycosyltransferase involved in cell wall biosynthesis